MTATRRGRTSDSPTEGAPARGEALHAYRLRLSDTLRALSDPLEIERTACRLMAEQLGAERAYLVEVDGTTGEFVVGPGHGPPSVPSLTGRFPLAVFEPFATEYQAGRCFVVADPGADERLSGEVRERLAAIGHGASIGAPVMRGGVFRALLAVIEPGPRAWTPDEVALVEESAGRAWAEVERARAEVALRASEAQLAAELADARQLQRISSSLIRDDEVGPLYDQLLDVARALMRSDMASLQMLDPERDELALLAQRGFAPESAAFWARVSADQASSCGVALANREPIVVPDLERWDVGTGTEDLRHYRLSGIRAVLSVPLVTRAGRVVGMVSTHWRSVHHPSERERRLLDVLARQAADLIERRRAEEELRQSEEKYRTLFESMGQGYCELELVRDAQGRAVDLRYLELNPSFERLVGVSAAVARGGTASVFFPTLEPWWYETYDRIARGGVPARIEHEVASLGRWYEAFVYPRGRDRLTLLYEDVTERKRAEAARAAERERLAVAEAVAAERHALIARIVRAQEEERARVARDVHDGVTQVAHAAALRLDGLVDDVGSRLAPEELADLERARDLARRAAADARRLIAGLRPETLDTLGLTGALRQAVEVLSAEGWRAELEDGDFAGTRLDPDAEITLYRVAQEALSNVRKHAGRARVRVRLHRHDGQVRLEVRDWGRGFDAAALRRAGPGERVGLTGMRERLALLGGELEVRSSASGGTTVRATVPIPPRADASH